jgi:hypothetical protein
MYERASIPEELQNEKNYFCSQEKRINVKLRSFCEKKLQGENSKMQVRS